MEAEPGDSWGLECQAEVYACGPEPGAELKMVSEGDQWFQTVLSKDEFHGGHQMN